MTSVNDDITVDGWLALCIAILRGVPQQEAFKMLENPTKRRSWTDDDFMQIEAMREEGESWSYIGKIMGVNKSNAFRQYYYWKEKQKKCR